MDGQAVQEELIVMKGRIAVLIELMQQNPGLHGYFLPDWINHMSQAMTHINEARERTADMFRRL